MKKNYARYILFLILVLAQLLSMNLSGQKMITDIESGYAITGYKIDTVKGDIYLVSVSPLFKV